MSLKVKIFLDCFVIFDFVLSYLDYRTFLSVDFDYMPTYLLYHTYVGVKA